MIENNAVPSVPDEKSEDQRLFDAVENFFSNGQIPYEKLQEYRRARNRIFAEKNDPMFCTTCKSFFAAGRLYLRAHRVISNRIELVCPICLNATTALAEKLTHLPSFKIFCNGLKHANSGDVIG